MGLMLIFIFTFQSTKKKTICLLKVINLFWVYTPKILAMYIFVCVFVGFKQYVWTNI